MLLEAQEPVPEGNNEECPSVQESNAGFYGDSGHLAQGYMGGSGRGPLLFLHHNFTQKNEPGLKLLFPEVLYQAELRKLSNSHDFSLQTLELTQT